MPGTTPRERLEIDARQLAERTADAYSYDRYGAQNWERVARLLLKRGYTSRQAEAIMRSKWMRWAGDSAAGRYRYGAVRAKAVAEWLDKYNPNHLSGDLNELVAGTFDEAGEIQYAD
jgi:hypothetical protein